MTSDQLTALCIALKHTKHPRTWFDDPIGVTGRAHDWHTWTHNDAYALPPFEGRRTATQTNDSKRGGLGLFLDTITGANLVWESILSFKLMPVAVGRPGASSSFASPWFFSMRMNRSNLVGTNAGDKWQGISWGDSFNVNTPWSTITDNFQGQGRLQLFWDYTLDKWRVLMVVGGTMLTIRDCIIQPQYDVDQNFPELSMLWIPPGNGYGRRFCCMLDGQIAFDVHDDEEPALEGIDSGSQTGPGIFWTNGSDAASRASEAGYYVGRFWIPLLYKS